MRSGRVPSTPIPGYAATAQRDNQTPGSALGSPPQTASDVGKRSFVAKKAEKGWNLPRGAGPRAGGPGT